MHNHIFRQYSFFLTTAVLFIGISPQRAFAQWADCSTAPAGNTLCVSGSNVGIGTTSPGANLHVKANGSEVIRAESTSANAYLNLVTSGGIGEIASNGGNISIGGNAAQPIYFRNNGYQLRMTIDASGSVGIGTTTPLAGTGLSGLHVFGTGVNTGIIKAQTTSDGAYVFVQNNGNYKALVGLNNTGGTDYAIGHYGTMNGSGLAFYTGASVSERMRIDATGNVGIGTISPSNRLSLVGGTSGANSLAGTRSKATLYIQPKSTSGYGLALGSGPSDFPYLQQVTIDGGAAGHMLLQPYGGNVGIGTTNPGNFKLAVEGGIGAREVTVTSANPWPDYVLQPGYPLRPLSEVAAYIEANHHLPEIPSAAEVKEGGIDLGSMQAKLLEKVEELTLHAIGEHERNDRLEKQNSALEERNAALLRRIERLEGLIK